MPSKRGANIKTKKNNRREAKKPNVKRIDYSADDRFGKKEGEEGGEDEDGSVALVVAESKEEQGKDDEKENKPKTQMDLLTLAEQNDPSVTELKLGNQDHFGNGGARHVASSLMNNTHVTLLWLNDNQIKDDGIKYLAKLVHSSTCLTELDLSNNLMEDLGAEQLTKALTNNWRIVKVNILGNKLSAEHASKINKMLLSPTIVRQALPRLQSNDSALSALLMPKLELTDSDVGSLMEAMSQSKFVKRVSLPKNHITGVGAHLLSKALQTIETVSVQGVTHTHCSVHTLDISENMILPRGGKEMAAMLNNNSTLHTLYLAGCGLGAEGARYIASALVKNDTIRRLFLDRNDIGDKGAIALSEAFDAEKSENVNKTLDTLWLTDNGIGRDGAHHLRVAMRIFDVGGPLSTLVLDGNEGVVKM